MLQEPGQPDVELLKKLVSTLKIPTNQLDIKMSQLATSNKSEDIATLAYIWGFQIEYTTVPLLLLAFLFLSISLHLLLLGINLSCIPQHGQNNPL
jgi:hypothetical protein